MDKSDLREKPNDLKKYILGLGADLAGFADLTAFPPEIRSDMPYGISIGIAINPAIIPLIPPGATMEYYEEYQNLNQKLDQIAIQLQDDLCMQGFHAIAQTVSFIQNQRSGDHPGDSHSRARMPHKTVASIAGLGWIGKSSLLITPSYGSAIRFTSVLTNAPIQTEKSTSRCLCGNCRICSAACPGHAIKNREWSIDCDRDDLFDFDACNKAVAERGKKHGIPHAACGVCMAVCPYTRRYASTVSLF